MKSLLQNSEKERDKCWLLFKTSFMKPLVAQFTLEPLFISFVSFFSVVARLTNLIAYSHMHKMGRGGPKQYIFGYHFYSKNARKLRFHVFLYFNARKHYYNFT